MVIGFCRDCCWLLVAGYWQTRLLKKLGFILIFKELVSKQLAISCQQQVAKSQLLIAYFNLKRFTKFNNIICHSTINPYRTVV